MGRTRKGCYACKGDNGMWGVCEGESGLVYGAIFGKRAAERIAELENSPNPPPDWRATERILIGEGLLEEVA